MISRFLIAVAGAALVCNMAFAESYEDAVEATLQNKPSDLSSILSKGFDPNTVTPGGTGDPLLSLAIRNKSNKVVDLLLSQPKTNLNAPNALNETPLMLAIYLKQNDTAKKLISKGAAINNPGYWSPLHYAAAADNYDMVKLLISKGADINARTLRGITPLYMAGRDGSVKTVKALLDAGARKDFCNNDMLAPYDIARQRNNSQEIIDLLKYDHCR